MKGKIDDVGKIFSEDQLQAACFCWFWNTIPAQRGMLFHVNQKARNRIEGNRMKAMGVVPGVSDFIHLSDPLNPGKPLFIEMKTKTGTQSDDQIRFQYIVEGLRYRYIICRSLDQFQEIVTSGGSPSGRPAIYTEPGDPTEK